LSLTREWIRLLREHRRMYSLRVSPALPACTNNVFFSPVVVRIWILSVVPCPFCGVSGRSPEQGAQPFLRVAERRIGEMVVGRAKPRRGFVSTSAYLAVPLNSSDFNLLHICCH
jgi:hypothetical protein